MARPFDRRVHLALLASLGCGGSGDAEVGVARCEQLQRAICARTIGCAEAAQLVAPERADTQRALCFTALTKARSCEGSPFDRDTYDACALAAEQLPCDQAVQAYQAAQILSPLSCDDVLHAR